MQEQLISFPTAKLAKEKGFNEPVLAIYSGNQLGYIQEGDELFRKWNHCRDSTYSAPTQSLLQKWLREEYSIYLTVWWYSDKDKFYYELGYKTIIRLSTSTGYKEEKVTKVQTGRIDSMYNSYEEALEAGLLEALKLIK